VQGPFPAYSPTKANGIKRSLQLKIVATVL
jgi:hypothetical protein